MVLYRKYRPQKLEDLVGHEQIVKTLLFQLDSGKISHGYLFYGPRGTGKTSVARILAKAVNCESKHLTGDKKQLTTKSQRSNVKGQMLFGEPCDKCLSCTSIVNGSNLDVVEIDAASNRGIDEIRDLREKIKLSPVSGRFKVYIIDEAHMLTGEAFNALLKTLEEPPAHVIFILCTTDVGKLPATIISRLARFNFRRATRLELVKVILKIAKAEKIDLDKDAVEQLADAADGSFRDAVSFLDQVSAKSGKIGASDIQHLAAAGGFGEITKFIGFIAERKLKEAVLYVEELAVSGRDIADFARNVNSFAQKLLFDKIGADSGFDELGTDERDKIRELSNRFTSEDLVNFMRLLVLTEGEIKFYPLAQIPLILALYKYINIETGADLPTGEAADQVSGPEAEDPTLQTPETPKKAEVKVENVKSEAKGSRVGTKSSRRVTLAQIEKKWAEFLELVRQVNIHVPALLKSTKTLDFDGENLKLEVFYRFHKDKLEEPKIIKILDERISQVMGSEIKFRFALAKKEAKPPAAVSASDVVNIRQDDLAQIAREIFSK